MSDNDEFESKPIDVGPNVDPMLADVSRPNRAATDALMTQIDAVAGGDADHPEPQIQFREPEPEPIAWVTTLGSLLCAGIFIGLHLNGNASNPATMHKFGWRSLDEIWDGQYWALVTTTFVHYSLLHVFFNVSAFRVLGEWMERAIGPIRFLIFCLVTAFVSSSFQVAVSSGTVVGISGIVYGIFGFMWLARWRFPEFHRVLDRRTIRMAFGWLLVCYLITFFDVLPIGNTAHTVGLAFGVLVAALFVLPRRRVLVVATLLALIAASVVPLYWSPWSADWLQHQAFAAHRAGRLTEAIDWYTKALELDPDDSWSLHNRGNCYLEIDEPLKALDDFNRAKQVVAGNRKRAASDSTKKDVK